MKSSIAKAAAACVLALGLSSAAAAAVVTETYSFTLNDFVDEGAGLPSPLAAITGSFTLTFDPTLYYDNDTTDIVVNYLSDPFIASPIGFDNFPGGPGATSYIAIGGIQFDADFISEGTDDFTLNLKYVDDPSTAVLALCGDGYSCGGAPPSAVASGYTLAGYPNSFWLPFQGSAAPEPATWTLLMGGFGLAGAGLRRRRATA